MKKVSVGVIAASLFSTAAIACQVIISAAPICTTIPSVSGVAQVGHVVTAVHGVWAGSPTSITDQWVYADTGAAIAGATALTYTPVAADVGHSLAITETATNAGGVTASTSLCL